MRTNKKNPVPHKVSERGLHLERAQHAQQNSNINTGQDIVLGQDKDGEDIRVQIGTKCPTCHKRIRGPNHVGGAHHRGLVQKRSRR